MKERRKEGWENYAKETRNEMELQTNGCRGERTDCSGHVGVQTGRDTRGGGVRSAMSLGECKQASQS